MRFVYEQVGIEASVTWVDRRESPQAPPPQRTVGKHSPAVLRDRQTEVRPQISEPAQHVHLTEKNQEGQDKDANRRRAQRYTRISPLAESQCCKQDEFENENHHSGARAGEKDRT